MPCCLIQIWGLPFWGILDNHFVALHTFHQNWGIQVYLCEVMWMFALLPHKHFIRIWGFKFTFVRKCGWSHCCPRIYFIRIWSFKFTFVRQCGWLPCCQAYISSRPEHSSLPLWGSVDDCFVAPHIFHQNQRVQVYLCEAVWMIALLPSIYFIWIWGVTPFR